MGESLGSVMRASMGAGASSASKNPGWSIALAMWFMHFETESVIDQFGDVSLLSHAPRSISRSYNPRLGMPESSALLCCLVTIETSPILLAALGVIITILAVEPGRSSIESISSYRSHKDLPFPLAGIMPSPVSAAVR